MSTSKKTVKKAVAHAPAPAPASASASASAAKPARRRATTSPWIKVRRSAIHGRGVVASKDIPSGTRIIEYQGERITKAVSERRDEERAARAARGGDACVYIFEVNKRHDLDGHMAWNTARLINHSCEPNCESEKVRGHIWITARRDIAAGEELTFDYGFDVENWKDHPCRCSSKKCVGYIVAKSHRWRLRKKIKKEREAVRVKT
jgi:SET domain-containing protein